MNQKANKLKTKDLIIAGAFAALYVVVMFASVSVFGLMPLLYIMAPLFMSIILGPIYMLYVTKVPKTGAILILAVLVGLVTSMGGMWFALVWSIAMGLIAELLARAGKYGSKRLYRVSYCVFACTNMGPFWSLALAKEAFLATCLTYYGAEYAASLDALTPSWIVLVLLGIALIGGVIGGALGGGLLKKHFEKAGVI